MSTIRILPDILSNKIAAGEVVERPASVVKELVENALDAQSTQITIEVGNGGRALIRVADNGAGMGRDDALLSVERYATSKIADDADLFSIRTLGFRGEALPSIAAVSRFTLVTRRADLDAGTEIVIEGGRIKQVSDAGAPPGTMISVRQIFFNTPARRKFLKSIATEMSHIADTVAGMALGRPDVRFKLIHNQKIVKDWTVAARPRDRVAEVLGRGLQKDLRPIESQSGSVAVSGWIASPRHIRSTSKGIFVFVNGRPVRDRIIQHALFQGYRQRLQKGQFPVAVLNIKVPFDQVDVNVHPTKNEVRFARQQLVHDTVQAAVASALAAADRPSWAPGRPVSTGLPGKNRIAEASALFGRSGQPAAAKVIEPEYTAPDKRARPLQAALWAPKRFADMQVIGQFYGTYILCESGEELVLIDQHAAHERILFEQLKRQAESSRKASQQLLVPETVELGFREAELISRLLPELQALGLEIEPFGGTTFVVKSAPQPLSGRELAPLVVEMAEKIAADGFGPKLEDTLEQCMIVMACHGTIRANQPLSDSEIRHLLHQLDQCENPSTCPHGRPTWIKWSLRAIEKSFGRTA